MQDNTYTTHICPHCGNPIQLPGGLAEFSCMYCGKRMTLADLASDPQPDQEESRQALTLLTDALPGCITGYPHTMKNLVPGKFPAYFEAYLAQHCPTLELIDSLDREALDVLARAAVAHVVSWIEDNKKPLVSADALLDEAKFTLCLVTIPAIRRAAPRQGLAFSQALHSCWLEQYPKSSFQITCYEDIAKGFSRRKLCFITTAVCAYLGKADDCRELTAFRAFRDGYLRCQSDGDALIRQYYRIAPGIVTAINYADDPDTVYPAIWQQHLKPCYEAICRGDDALCKVLYTRMVQQLAARYLAAESAA